jgi:hypothetical protein
MTREAYENVKDQHGACGIWCGSCAVGNGSIRELAERLGIVLDSHGAEHWTPTEMDYRAFARGLSTIGESAACTGCRKGGGRDDCPMRVCSVDGKLAACTDCSDFGSCPNDELLQHMRDGARKARLFVRDPGEDESKCMEAWAERVMTTWPSSLLFLEEP